MLSTLINFALLAFGFGFVIFFHELGHFLAAKKVGIRVEQFAVGFGQAILCYRKGIGLRIGTTRPQYEAIAKEHLARNEDRLTEQGKITGRMNDEERINVAAEDAGLSETEYRWNWIPLGGYVKMVGQDDMKPGQDSNDPKAYNRKSIGARMLVVSAGVIMNIILAAIGFMVVFMMGLNAPAPMVGQVIPGSPADQAVKMVDGAAVPAPLQVGDEIRYFEGKFQHDFMKIALNVALSEESITPMLVKRVDGHEETVYITPRRQKDAQIDLLSIGIGQGYELRGLPLKLKAQLDALDKNLLSKDQLLLEPGDVVKKIGDQDVTDPKQFYLFDRALQAAQGKPVELTVESPQGQQRKILVNSYLPSQTYDDDSVNFLGLVPRAQLVGLNPDSVAIGKVQPNDVVVSVAGADGKKDYQLAPSGKQFRAFLTAAGKKGEAVRITVQRESGNVELAPIVPKKLDSNLYGLGVALDYDAKHAVTAAPLPGSAAAKANIPAGASLLRVGGTPVNNWFEVKAAVANAKVGEPLEIVANVDGASKTFTIDKLSADDALNVAQNRARSILSFGELTVLRQAPNPAIAAAWGVTETRDFVLQFYVTLKRMFQGNISPKHMMGPIGIFDAGTKVAEKGWVWLIWFLSMISANLAVVNFLPIPIVDGGLFTFLLIEKIQGRPVSQRTQSVAQIVGLAIILSIFVFVTVQDISRFFH